MTPPNPQPPSERDTAALRALIRARRRALGGSERRAAERTITALLVDVGELLCGPEQPGRPPLDVGWYRATDGEVDLGGVVDELRDRGHRLWLPVVCPDTTMRFRRWEPRTEMTTNRYGIPEPVASADDPTAERPASGLDVVIVPSVVLDRVGHRVGFGAGYYDRALADATVTTIGVGFAVQLVEELTPQPWDVTLDVVVTDEGVIRLGAT